MFTPRKAEIKLNFVASQIAIALAVLELDPSPSGSTYFLEDSLVGAEPRHPLLDAGVVLRVRVKGGKRSDITVKFRPCRLSQLPDAWSEPFSRDDTKLKIEQDWSGARHAVAASLVVDLPTAELASRVADGTLHQAFSSVQRDFLRDCAPIRINLSELTTFGPIEVDRWPNVAHGDLSLNVERWRAGNLDTLEISVLSDLDTATAAQHRLMKAVEDAGITPDTSKLNKTELFVSMLGAADGSHPDTLVSAI